MKKIFIGLLSLCLSMGFLQAQDAFKGTIAYSYDIKGDNAEMMKMFLPEKMVIKYGEYGMLTSMEGGLAASMMGTIVVNTKSEETFMVMNNEKLVYLLDTEEVDQAEEPSIKTTVVDGPLEEILGHKCQKYKMESTQSDETTTQYVWVAKDLKAPKLNMSGADKMNQALSFGNQFEGLPLMMEIKMPQMDAVMVLKAIELSEGVIEHKTFERPADYEVKDFSEFNPAKF